jgi:hypothetical protein
LARLGALAAGLLLGACAGDIAPISCPPVGLVPGAERLIRFSEGSSDLTDVVLEARIEIVEATCEADDEVIEAPLKLRVSASRGPALKTGATTLDYFVAVATREREILTREAFRVELPFGETNQRLAVLDEILPRIPLGDGKAGSDYRIYVGLALSEAELRYNRTPR